MEEIRCPLCKALGGKAVHRKMHDGLEYRYHGCLNCGMVWLDRSRWPDPETEKRRYLEHRNDLNEPGYRGFLEQLLEPVRWMVPMSAAVLDFGSGPDPAAGKILEEEGFDVDYYDPFFNDEKKLLDGSYGLVLCTEVVEHFHHPLKEFQLLDRLMELDGVIGIMTGLLDGWESFPDWHYHSDLTHVVFYQKKTMEWIAERLNWGVSFPKENITVFTRSGSPIYASARR